MQEWEGLGQRDGNDLWLASLGPENDFNFDHVIAHRYAIDVDGGVKPPGSVAVFAHCGFARHTGTQALNTERCEACRD